MEISSRALLLTRHCKVIPKGACCRLATERAQAQSESHLTEHCLSSWECLGVQQEPEIDSGKALYIAVSQQRSPSVGVTINSAAFPAEKTVHCWESRGTCVSISRKFPQGIHIPFWEWALSTINMLLCLWKCAMFKLQMEHHSRIPYILYVKCWKKG